MTDMEGAAGIINSDDYCVPSGRYYEMARKIVTEEANAAIERLIEAGADDFLVVDSHGYGAIDPLLLHPSLNSWPVGLLNILSDAMKTSMQP